MQIQNTNPESSRPGFERVSTPEHVEKLRQLGVMRERFNNSQFERGSDEHRIIQEFLRRYGAFMSADNYRTSNQQPFNEAADILIAEGETILNELGIR